MGQNEKRGLRMTASLPRLQPIRYATDRDVQRFCRYNALSTEADALCVTDMIAMAIWLYGEEACADLRVTVH
jgi:hypothetical protein